MKNFISKNEKETEKFAENFAKELKGGDVVSFFGDLGAGKTAFVRGAVSHLCPGAFVCSPTYAIMNEYQGGKYNVCHFDLYRIHGEDDLFSIGFDDYLTDKNIIFTEWSENVAELLPLPRYEITVTKLSENERNIEINYME